MLRHRHRGFTLIELIIVILLMSLLSVLVTQLLSRPFYIYHTQQTRSQLVSQGQLALDRMTEELRSAIPNTIRIYNQQALEFAPSYGSGRYRSGNPGDISALSVRAADREFNSLLPLPDSDSYRLTVYNTSPGSFYTRLSGADSTDQGSLSAVNNEVSISQCSAADCNELQVVPHVRLTRPHRFDSSGSGSPARRFYLANDSISYFCDPAAGDITRFQGYSPASAQPTSKAALQSSSADSAPLLENISSCRFTFQPGLAGYRNATISLLITLSRGDQSITLFREVHLWNTP